MEDPMVTARFDTNPAAAHFDLCDQTVLAARLRWDAAAASAADADLQAVVVDRAGRIVDAAYYNNLKACGGRALVHTGDEGGEAGGRGLEEVRLSLARVPPEVHMVFFLVCSFNGGALRDVPGLRLAFEQEKPTRRLLSDVQVSLPCRGLLAAAAVRGEGTAWQLKGIGEQLADAHHFMDCLPELNAHIVKEIPTAARKQKVAFAMEKGGNLDFGAGMQSVVLGLGWDTDRGQVDLDASAVLLDASGTVLESVFFGNLRSTGRHSHPGAVEHSGDNLTGDGDGDDERITVHLSALGQSVSDVFFCIHVYSRGEDGRPKTFMDVAEPYCRVLDAHSGEELCRYTLREAGSHSGLIIARLRRGPGGRFGFNALGLPCGGTLYKDAFPDVQHLGRVDPRAMQAVGCAR